MNTTHIGYTAAGDLASYQDPAGTLTQYVYDFNNLNSTIEPSNGFDQTTYYDGFGHIKSSQDGDVNTTGWTYDLMGHVTSMTDAAGHVISIAPTTGSNGVSLCDASMQCAYSYYDNASKLTSTVDKRGLTTTYTYDSLDRLSVKTVNSTNISPFEKHIFTYGYDSLNRVTSLTDSYTGLTTNITYDGINDVLSEATPALNNTVTYGYDGDGRRTSLSASGGGHAGVSYGYSYDIASDLTGITGGPETVTIVPDGAGRRSTLTVGNVVTTYGYDADSRVTSLSYTSGGNSIGNLTYTYDSNGRLATVGGSLAGINLGTAEGASTLNTFWPTNQINGWNGTTITHDSANNLTQLPVSGVGLTWNARSELSSFSGIPFSYDQFGRRYAAGWSSGTVNFLSDGHGVIQAASSSEVDTAFRIGSGEVLAYTSTIGSNGTTLIPIHDRLGSTIGLVNPSTGALQTQYSYDAYGNVTAAGTASNFPFLFAGMEYDIPTGLYHTLARYYAPSIQRFLSEDPKGIGGGDINLFTYVANSPTSGVDPLGQDYLNGDYPTLDLSLIAPTQSESIDPMGTTIQGAVFAGQQSPSIQTTIGGGGQGGGTSINISSGGANQQESSFNNGTGYNVQSQSFGNGPGAGFSTSGTRPTPALGNVDNPGASPNAPAVAAGVRIFPPGSPGYRRGPGPDSSSGCSITPEEYDDFVETLGDFGTFGMIIGGGLASPGGPAATVIGAVGGAAFFGGVYSAFFWEVHCQ